MISKIERGESSPTAVVLGKLSAALELSVSELLSVSEPPAASRPRGRPEAGLGRGRRRGPGAPGGGHAAVA